MGTDSWAYRLLVALSGITLILVVVYIVLIQDNRSVQAEVNQRQQFINQSIQLGRVNDALIRALAAMAVSNNDDKLHELLAQNGIATGAPEKQATPAAPATPVDIGAARVGNGSLSGNLSVTNTAANHGFSENLNANISATSGNIINSSGQVIALAPQQTNGNTLNVTFDSSSAGAKSGTATA